MSSAPLLMVIASAVKIELLPPTTRSVLASLSWIRPLTDIPLPFSERLMPPDIVSPRICSNAFARLTELGVLKMATSSGSGSSKGMGGTGGYSNLRCYCSNRHCLQSNSGLRPWRRSTVPGREVVRQKGAAILGWRASDVSLSTNPREVS